MYERRPSRRRCRRAAVASCGPKVWVQVSTVRAETSMPRSAKELGDLPGRERVAQVPTDRGEDDLRWPPIAREGAVGSVSEVPMTEMAREALTAAAVETIARSGGLVAGRAGGHRSTPPRAPHNFADSTRPRLRRRLRHSGRGARHREHPHTHPGTSGERHRGAGCAEPTLRVSGSHPAAERMACPIGVGRVRELLQPGSTPSIARNGDSGAEPPQARRRGGLSSCPQRLTPRLRASRLTPIDFSRPTPARRRRRTPGG